MTTKKKEADQTIINIEPVKRTLLKVELIGTSDLILRKKSRSFELAEIWKQSHDKGEKIPNELSQPYNLFEKLITSIDWKEPITFHDDDWSKYTQEEWEYYMQNNAPCINSQHIFGSLYEAFVSFGYKDSTGKNGTDIKRSVSLASNHFPIQFSEVRFNQELIPTNGKSQVNVLGQSNIFSGWKCNIKIYTADVAFPTNTVIDLLSTAGNFIGLATQRKNGYGRFALGKIEKETL